MAKQTDVSFRDEGADAVELSLTGQKLPIEATIGVSPQRTLKRRTRMKG